MKKYNISRAILLASVLPFIFFLLQIWEMKQLVAREALNEKETLLTLLDPNGGGITGAIICMLFFIPAAVAIFEQVQKADNNWEFVRFKTRDTYTIKITGIALRYSFGLTVFIELMKMTMVAIFLGKDFPLSSDFVEHILTDLLINFAYFFRAVCLYLNFRAITDSKLLSLIVIVFIYFIEYVLSKYIFPSFPLFPSLALTAPFSYFIGEIGGGLLLKEILLSLGLDLLLTLWLFITVRKKDVIGHGK